MKFINCAQPHCKSIKTRFIFHILTLQHKHAKPQVQRKTGKFGPCIGLCEDKANFSYFFQFYLKTKIIYFLSYTESERLKFCDSNGIFLNYNNQIDHEITSKNHQNLHGSLS